MPALSVSRNVAYALVQNLINQHFTNMQIL